MKPLLEQGELSLSSLSVIAPILTQENAKTILPEVVGKPVREVEKVVHKHFPERASKTIAREAIRGRSLSQTFPLAPANFFVTSSLVHTSLW